MGDDESRVGDRVRREGGGALASHGGTQSLGCLTDRKGEGCVLLNVSEKCHRISMPWWGREWRYPRFGDAGHGASSADSRLPVVAVMLCGIGCPEFLFNQRGWCHETKSFRYQRPAGGGAGHCDELNISSASCCLQTREGFWVTGQWERSVKETCRTVYSGSGEHGQSCRRRQPRCVV